MAQRNELDRIHSGVILTGHKLHMNGVHSHKQQQQQKRNVTFTIVADVDGVTAA